MTNRRNVFEVGQRFGRGVVIDPDIRVEVSAKRPSGRLGTLLLCDCGNTYRVRSEHLRDGHTNSCGCYQKSIMAENPKAITHGLSHHPHFKRWAAMMRRCYSSNDSSYQYYGGRGIRVYEPWHDPSVFLSWMDRNLGQCPDGLSMDRIDVDGDYEPGNLRWATHTTQMINRRAWKKRGSV